MVPPGRQGPDGRAGGAPAWALADDVFAQRYEPGTSHTEGAWQLLPQLTLQLDAGTARQAQKQDSAATGVRVDAAAPAPTSAAAAAAPQQDPWLLAAAAYAAEAGAGWQGGGRGARARMLFQYKPYSKQEPLDLSEAEVAAVVEAVFGRVGALGPPAFQEDAAALWDSLSHGALFGLSSAATTGEVAAVILIKLVMDLYVRAGARAAFPLVLLLLQKPLLSGDPATQCRVFDMLYNLSIHGELLYDTAAEAVPEDAPVLAEAVAELDLGSDKGPALANWKATVTSAFRATLAASLRSGTFNPRSHLDAGSGGSGANGTHHATSRGSLDGRSMRSSLDGGATRSSGGTAPTRLGPGGAAAAAAAGAAAEWPPLLGQRPPARCARAERFQQWLRLLLFQLMGALAAVSGSAPGSAAAAAGAAPEGPWVSALSSLLHLGSYEGRIVRAFVEDLPLGVVAALLEQSRRHCWSEHLHAWLVSLAANLLYAHSDQEEGGLQRSVKAVSLRSDGTGSATGSMHRAPSCPSSDLSWWSGSQLDFDRLAAFGGMRHVLQCYREAPTAAARRNMFSVLFDYVVAGQRPASQDSWAPVLLHPAHSSERLALGAALLRMGAADALHPQFLAGVSGTMQHVADAVSVQMAALQAANPGRVVSAPAAMVNECVECLEEMATADVQVPLSLQEAVKQSLEAVGAPETHAGAASTPDARAAWGCLADCMRDGSELGSRVGRGWLLQLLVAAAEHELAISNGGDGGGDAQLPQQQEDEGGEAAPSAAAAATPLPALLPEVAAHGGCQLEERRRGMQGQGGLRELLMRALATTPDSRAADCFISAVGSLLAHVRLRCAAVGLDTEDGWAGNGGSSASFGTALTPGPSASSGGEGDFRTPLSASASGSALRAPGSAARLSAMQSPSAHSRQHSRQQLAAQASVDSLPDAETSAVRIVPSESLGSMAQSSPSDGQGGMWRNINCAEVVIATLSLAVEWLLQAPQEARQGAMLHATQLLLSFTLAPRQPCSVAANGTSSLSASFAQGGGLDTAAGMQTSDALPGSPAPAPGAVVTPGSRQRGSGPPHRLAGQAPTPLQIPPSPGMSTTGPELTSPSGLPQRPVSPSMAALKAAAASAAASAAGTPATSTAPRPATPRASSFERLQGAGEPSAADIAAAAAVAVAGSAAATAAEHAEQAAAEAAQVSATQLWSFLNGDSMVPPDLLRLMPPLLLRTLFEDLRPDSSALHYDALATAGAGAPASRLTKAADAALSLKAAVQAGRPLWDARAAVLLLLMARCAADAAALRALGGTSFFSGLLGEPDVRVRHYAAVFVLRQLMLQQPLQYRRALRGVVARAQSANDEKLLANPYLQLRAMLELGRVQLEGL